MEHLPIIYIDFECDNNRQVIEFAALCVQNGCVLEEIHYFIRQPLKNKFAYFKTAENSHCIEYKTLFDKGIDWTKACSELYKLIVSFNNNLIIKGYGTDVNEQSLKATFSFLKNMDNIKYEQVILPNWVDRQYERYHVAANNMKNNSYIISCNSLNHCLKFFPHWLSQGKTPTHSQLAKRSYGFHCALIDTYELAFKDKTLDIYCCDVHFANNFTQKCNSPLLNVHNHTLDSSTDTLFTQYSFNPNVCKCNDTNCCHDVTD